MSKRNSLKIIRVSNGFIVIPRAVPGISGEGRFSPADASPWHEHSVAETPEALIKLVKDWAKKTDEAKAERKDSGC